MKKIDFDNYKFGVDTKIKFDGKWHYITGVDFELREIGIYGIWIDYKEVKGILEVKRG